MDNYVKGVKVIEISCTYKSLKVQLFVTSHIAGSPEAGAVPEWDMALKAASERPDRADKAL